MFNPPRRVEGTSLALALSVITSACLALICGAPAFALPGALDTSFGTGGKVITVIGNGLDLAHGLAIQVDGKIVVVGGCSIDAPSDPCLVRYNTDGSLDTSFGGTGKVIR